MIKYDYVIVGAGIAGCSVAHFLKDENVLLVDRNEDVAFGASGAAGAFLSPLLGKPNKFKDLVSEALNFSVNFYKEVALDFIINSGVIRVPKDEEDKVKFQEYKKYIDFEFQEKEEGLFFNIGSQVFPDNICKTLSKNASKKFNYEIKHINFNGVNWILNDEIEARNLIITSGADTKLIQEKYLNIKAIWGQKIDITTTTCIDVNYHKECSLASTIETDDENLYKTSIGATHHRFSCDKDVCNYCVETANINKKYANGYTNDITKSDTKELLLKANDIKALNNVNVVDIKIGARASSNDYFPIVGELIDSEKTIDMFPHLKKGTHVKSDRFTKFERLFIINGVGGRGFVLSPLLAKKLVDFIKKDTPISEDISADRLFKRWVRKL